MKDRTMTELDQVQMTIEQAEKKILKAKEFTELLENPLFKKLITEEYLGDDAVRLTMLLGSSDESDKRVNQMLTGKSMLSRYIGHKLSEAEEAEEALAEHLELQNTIISEAK